MLDSYLPPPAPFTNFKYLAPADTWTSMKTSPTQRNGVDHGASAAAAMDRIYLLGGRNEAFPSTSAGQVNEAYDPVTDMWTSLQALPVGRGGGAIGVKSNRVYLVGGVAAGNMVYAMCIYNPATDVWTTGPISPRHIGQAIGHSRLPMPNASSLQAKACQCPKRFPPVLFEAMSSSSRVALASLLPPTR